MQRCAFLRLEKLKYAESDASKTAKILNEQHTLTLTRSCLSNITVCGFSFFLQCFDTVGWVTGGTSGL